MKREKIEQIAEAYFTATELGIDRFGDESDFDEWFEAKICFHEDETKMYRFLRRYLKKVPDWYRRELERIAEERTKPDGATALGALGCVVLGACQKYLKPILPKEWREEIEQEEERENEAILDARRRFIHIDEETPSKILKKALTGEKITFDDFIGQEEIVKDLKDRIIGSKLRGKLPPHILITGPAGFGKTTLARIVANTLETPFVEIMGSGVKGIKDIRKAIGNLTFSTKVVFIDEIHRLPITVAENLYRQMEEQKDRLLIIGATTSEGLMPKPFLSRFGIRIKMGYYSDSDILRLLIETAKKQKVEYEDKALQRLARVSKGIPRLALQYFDAILDYATVYTGGVVTEELVGNVLTRLKVDELGLTELDREILRILSQKALKEGGAIGLKTLSQMVNEDEENIENVIEPYLLRLGFIERTPQGRTITTKGIKYLIDYYREESKNGEQN